MRLTTLQEDETSASALVDRIYPKLPKASRKKAEAALLKANPHLAVTGAFRPGVVVSLPSDPELKPRPGIAGKDPVEDMLGTLNEAVSGYHEDLVKRLGESIVDMTSQEEILKQREVVAAIEATPGAVELAKSLTRSLREGKKAAGIEKEAYHTTFAAIAKDIGSLLGRAG